MQLIKRDAKRTGPEQSGISSPHSAPSKTAAAPIGASAAKIESITPSVCQSSANPPTQKSDFRDQQRANSSNVCGVSADKGHNELRAKEMVGGIDAEMYAKLVKELGKPARRRKRIDVPLAEKMHRLGWTHKQIAKHFGCSPCTIRRRLEEAKRRRANKIG